MNEIGMNNNFDTVIHRMMDTAKGMMPPGSSVLLYGSRARHEEHEDSDWDLLILLDKDKIDVSDYDNIAYPFTSLGWDLGEAIIPVMYTKENWKRLSFMPFNKNVERDKLVIYES